MRYGCKHSDLQKTKYHMKGKIENIDFDEHDFLQYCLCRNFGFL